MHAESNDLQDYLIKSEVIDYDHKLIFEKCLELQKGMKEEDEISLIKKIYEFVRDDIHHSGDTGAQEVPVRYRKSWSSGMGSAVPNLTCLQPC